MAKYEEAQNNLDNLKYLRHKYICKEQIDEKLEDDSLNTDALKTIDALKELHYERANKNIYQIAKKIKHRASIYGIYTLNDKTEETCLKLKMVNKRLENVEILQKEIMS